MLHGGKSQEPPRKTSGVESQPWEEVKRQKYLGSKKLIDKHSPGKPELTEIPRRQMKPIKPKLEQAFGKDSESGIAQADREHGYRLHKIAKHLGAHYATVSRRLKEIERQK